MDANKIELSLPGFCGFYESRLSGALDSVEEQEAEHFAVYREHDDGTRGSVLDARDYAELFMSHARYGIAFDAIARAYVDAASDVLNLALSELDATPADAPRLFEFSRLVSPREYNFSTDELCVFVSAETWGRMVAEVNDADVTDVATERHTSRSGFASFYSPDWRSWGDVSGYDDVQRDTLFRAWLRGLHSGFEAVAVNELSNAERDEDDTGRLFGSLVENRVLDDHEVFSDAWERCMDWPAFDAAEKALIVERENNTTKED